MSKQETVEIFRNHGVNVSIDDTPVSLMRALKENDPDTLWPILEDFTGNRPIGINFANESMHSYTLSYALVQAFEQGKDSISQEDIDAAFQKATGLAESLSPNGSTRPDRVIEGEEENDGDDAPTLSKPVVKKRTRDGSLLPLIESIVEENAKASNDEILALVLERKPSAKENTVRSYISKARGNLGLKAQGKRRGRKSSGIYEEIKAMVEANPDLAPKELVERITAELTKPNGDPVPLGTAQAYSSKARKELGL